MWVLIGTTPSASSYQGMYVYGDTLYMAAQANRVDVRDRLTGSLITQFTTIAGSSVISICRFGDSLCISRLSSPERCEVYTLNGTYVRTFYPSGGQQVRGLDWDGTKFWASSYGTGVTIYTMNTAGTVLKTLTRSGGNPVTVSIARDLSLDRMYANRFWSIPSTSSPYKVMYCAFDTIANTWSVLDTFQTGLSTYSSPLDFYHDPVIGGCVYTKGYTLTTLSQFKVHNPLATDVGSWRPLTPFGSVTVGAVVAPACTVYNFGSTTAASYWAKLRIGPSYLDSVQVTGHLAGTPRYLTFANWTASTAGTFTVSCSTALTGDLAPANNMVTRRVTVVAPDAGVSHLLAPSGTVDSGAVVTPACSTRNYGTVATSYWVKMRIEPSYLESAYVAGHAAGSASYVTFADWTAAQCGTLGVSCSTEVAGDNNSSNDRKTGSVNVAPLDAGCVVLVSPVGTVDSGEVVAPACTTANFSNTTALNYWVKMRIEPSYLESTYVTAQPAGTRQYVTFPDWTASQRGTFGVSCSTELTGDGNAANDRQTGSVDVQVIDAGVTQTLAPTGTVTFGTVVTPACSVYNYGTTTPTSYNVRMVIGADYNNVMPVAGHVPGTWVYVTFPNWTADEVGEFAITNCTELPGDVNPGNDCDYDTVEVVGGDVGVSDISVPAGLVAPGTVVTPRVRITNYTADDATCDAHFVIRDAGNAEVYSQTVTGIDVAGNGFTNQNFPAWTANPVGSYTTIAWTVLAGDTDPSNDTATGDFSVNVATAGTWTEVPSPIPLTPSGKQVKDGAWLVEDGGRFYVAKGYKTGDFYFCDADTFVWHDLPTWPLGTEAKQPNKGSVGCVGNDGYIYATKGNNTVGFWRFLPGDPGTWEQLTDVPLGLSNKKVKGGTDMVYVRGRGGDSSYIYLLKGYKTEFYRFNVGSLTWQTLADAPAGAKPKWDKGSWLVSRRFGNDSTLIYAHKAKYHEFFTFNDSTLAWSQTSLTGMPFPSTRTGKNKKSKDGGCAAFYDDAIWALKGGNTAEFWRYDVLLGTWDECDTMPQFGSTGKKKRVKAGADIVEYDDVFYALKGNKTGEFWKYTPGVVPLAAPERSGVMAERTLVGTGFVLGPNPLASGCAVLRYSLPSAGSATVKVIDVTGRTVLAQGLATGRYGSTQLDLRGLSAGVYLVRLESDSQSSSRKLVIQ